MKLSKDLKEHIVVALADKKTGQELIDAIEGAVGGGLTAAEVQALINASIAALSHGDLSGLIDDDHLQYFLTNGNRAMTGNIDVNNNDIDNADLINATSGLKVQSGPYIGEYQSQQVILTDSDSVERTKITLGRIDLKDSNNKAGTIRQEDGDLNFSTDLGGKFRFNAQRLNQIGYGTASDDAVAVGQFSHYGLFYVATNGNDLTADGSFVSPYQTIAAAVDAAPSGSTIQLFPGAYTEPAVVLPDQIAIKGMGEGVTVVTNGFSHTSTATNISLLFEDLNFNSLSLDAALAVNGTVKIRCSGGVVNRSDNNGNVFFSMTESNLFGGTLNGNNDLSEVLIISSPTVQSGLCIIENSKLVSRIEAEGNCQVVMLDCGLFGPTEFINGTIVDGFTPIWQVDVASDYFGGYTGDISKQLLFKTPALSTALVTSSTYLVSATDHYVGVNYAGAVSITLPSATDGRVIIIKDESGNCSTNSISLIGTVDNDIGGAVLAIDNGALHLIYRDGWRVI